MKAASIAAQAAPEKWGRLSVLLLCIIAGLCLTRIYSYLLFHATVEIFTVSVGWGVFFLAWSSRRFLDNHYLLFLGIAFLFTGGLDLLHTLAYRGMGVLPGGANVATQFWVAGRYVQSVSLLLAPVFFRRRLRATWVFSGFTAAGAVLFWSILHSRAFPDAYIDGKGLTPFKVWSEFAVVALLTAALLVLCRRREVFDASVFRLLAASIAFLAVAELAFMAYSDVFGAVIMAGHLIRFTAFCLIYRAILVTGVVRPNALLFRSLATSEEALRAANADLESAVIAHERTAEERERLIADLRQALAEVKRLSGLLPICARCKKIRDDKGYWNQVESYITQRSEASFTHGLCPECADIYYQDLRGPD